MNQFNPDQNPFEAFLNAPAEQQGAQSQTPPQSTPQMNPEMMVGGGGGKMQVPAEQQDITQPGVTGDNAKPLMSAMQALHGFIGSTTDPQKIQIVRYIMGVLTKLIEGEQETSLSAQNQVPPQVGVQA